MPLPINFVRASDIRRDSQARPNPAKVLYWNFQMKLALRKYMEAS